MDLKPLLLIQSPLLMISQKYFHDLPGILPERKIDFSIDLIPNIQPISILPFCMAQEEIKELKEKLQDLLDNPA